jgi:hypothetical protein
MRCPPPPPRVHLRNAISKKDEDKFWGVWVGAGERNSLRRSSVNFSPPPPSLLLCHFICSTITFQNVCCPNVCCPNVCCPNVRCPIVLSKCVLSKCVLSKCVLSKCVLFKCVLSKCVLAKCVLFQFARLLVVLMCFIHKQLLLVILVKNCV